MSLARIKHRSRQRLETEYHNKSPVIGPLVIGIILVLAALFVLPSKTVFRCSKTLGAPSLNDLCSYESTTMLAGSSLARLILPRFITGQQYFFHLGYIKGAEVITNRHEDTEHRSVSYTYDVQLVQRTELMSQNHEKERRAKFFGSAENLHYPEFSASSISLLEEHPIYSGLDSQEDAFRLRNRINNLIRQYENNPQQSLYFEKSDESWMDEIFLISGLGLIAYSSCLVGVSETISLDDDNKTLVIITKPLLGFVLNTEFIPISQITKFDIKTTTTRRVREFSSGSRVVQHSRNEPSYTAILLVKGANAMVQPSPHRVTNANGQNPPQQPAPPASPIPPHNNASYSPVVGEDGEYVLLNQPSTPRPQPPPPPPPLPTRTQPRDRTIELLCGQSYGEGHQGAVTEYVTLFQDWISDYQRRNRMKEEERDHILKMAEQALQRQLVRETADSLCPPTTQGGVVNRHDRNQSTSPSNFTLNPTTRVSLLENDFGHDNDEVIDETPEQAEQDTTSSQFGDSVEEVPTAPLLEASDIELSEQQIAFLLRRRNQRLLHDRLEQEGETNTESGQESPNASMNVNPSQGRVCCVCMDENEPVKTVLMPCKHLILCSACSSACDKCPLCRRPITYTIDVFY